MYTSCPFSRSGAFPNAAYNHSLYISGRNTPVYKTALGPRRRRPGTATGSMLSSSLSTSTAAPLTYSLNSTSMGGVDMSAGAVADRQARGEGADGAGLAKGVEARVGATPAGRRTPFATAAAAAAAAVMGTGVAGGGGGGGGGGGRNSHFTAMRSSTSSSNMYGETPISPTAKANSGVNAVTAAAVAAAAAPGAGDEAGAGAGAGGSGSGAIAGRLVFEKFLLRLEATVMYGTWFNVNQVFYYWCQLCFVTL
jgi:hypothetical protein